MWPLDLEKYYGRQAYGYILEWELYGEGESLSLWLELGAEGKWRTIVELLTLRARRSSTGFANAERKCAKTTINKLNTLIYFFSLQPAFW